jgi:hypothetical protein
MMGEKHMTALKTTLHNWHLPGLSLFLSEQIRHTKQGLTPDFSSQDARISGGISPSTLR